MSAARSKVVQTGGYFRVSVKKHGIVESMPALDRHEVQDLIEVLESALRQDFSERMAGQVPEETRAEKAMPMFLPAPEDD